MPTGTSTGGSWIGRAAAVLYVAGLLQLVVSSISTTITREWSYAACFATAAIGLFLAGLAVTGFSRRQST